MIKKTLDAVKLKSTLWSYISETYLKRHRTSEAINAAHNAIAADTTNQKGSGPFLIIKTILLFSGHACLARALSAFGDCSVQIATGIAMMASSYKV